MHGACLAQFTNELEQQTEPDWMHCFALSQANASSSLTRFEVAHFWLPEASARTKRSFDVALSVFRGKPRAVFLAQPEGLGMGLTVKKKGPKA